MGKVNRPERRASLQQDGQQHDLANEDADGVEVAALSSGQSHPTSHVADLSGYYWPQRP
jgi:hypothetical protein